MKNIRWHLAALLALLAAPALAQDAVVVTATSNNTTSVVPIISAAAEGSHILKAGPGNLYGFSATTGASAGFIQVFDAVSAPADGAVTPIYCYSVPASSSIGASWAVPAQFTTGITIVFSTGANCFTKTISATAFFAGVVK